jgi:hypothetical protein
MDGWKEGMKRVINIYVRYVHVKCAINDKCPQTHLSEIM